MDVSPDDASQPPIYPPGSVVYEVTYTDEHVIGLWQHLRQLKRRSRIFMRVFRVAAGLVLAGLFVLVSMNGNWRQDWHLATSLLGLLCVLGALVFSEQIDRWFVVRRWRKALTRNKRATISFNSEGLSGRSEFGQVANYWAAYSAAVRFPDGFLIFSGPYLPQWFRDADLVQGTPDEAQALFKRNVPNYKPL